MTKSCSSSGVPRISSTQAVSTAFSGAGPYTRPLAITTPMAIASAIDSTDSTRVITVAVTNDGKYRNVASQTDNCAAEPWGCGGGPDSSAVTRAYRFR